MKKKVSNATADNASKSPEKVKAVKKKKEATKSREWERDRRERLNNSFTNLSKLLPTSNNVPPTKKMEILQKASSFITALQQENVELLQSGGLEKSWSREVKQLQCQVKELTNRIQQLASLLQEAGGKLPSWVTLPANQQIPPPLGKRQFLYSNKISQETVEKHLTEPKHKKSKKSALKEKGSTESKKKKLKIPRKKTENLASNANQIKPPSVAQLLNSSSSSKSDETTNASGLVILPPEKQPSSIDLSSGILVLKGNSQPSIAPSTKNNLTSGLLIVHSPAPTPSLTAGACLLLSSSSAVTTSPAVGPATSQGRVLSSLTSQNPVFGPITGQQRQQAQTTTLLTAPIMATGQPSSNSTFVVTNGNFVPVLPKPSGSQPNTQSSLDSKLKQEIINGTKVAIPKLPKINIKVSNKQSPKKKKLKTCDVDLQPLKSIVTPSNNDLTPKDTVKNVDSSCKESISTDKKIIKESKENQSVDKTKTTVENESSKKVVDNYSEISCEHGDNKSSVKSTSKSSYSIDALCIGKSVPVRDVPPSSQSAVVTDKGDDKEVSKKYTETPKEQKTFKNKQKETEIDKNSQILNKNVCVVEKPKDLTPKVGEIVNNENKENKKTGSVETSAAELGSSMTYSDNITRNYFTGFEPCIRADFVAAEISPSGFIGPQPPMATVVDAPLTKETLESFSSNFRSTEEEEETCRADNQESEVPNTFSSDLFASLNVPSGHPESISPTAAFLLAFPLVSSSSGRVNDIDQNEMQRAESCSSNHLLQLGTMDENQPAVVELMHHRHHIAMLDTPSRHHNTIQETPNVPPSHGDAAVYKSPSKPLLSNVLPPCSHKHHEISTKHYSSHAMMQHNFLGNDQQVNDYDAEISSIMSSNAHVILPVTTSETKISSQRNVTTNSSCRIKTSEKNNQYARNQAQSSSEKQFVPVPNPNSCSQNNIAAESQQRNVGNQISQQQQPLYRPCNANKKQLTLQQNSYQNDSYTNALQNSSNSRCNPVNYKQPVFSTGITQASKPLSAPSIPHSEVCVQKIATEQSDASHFISKLHGGTKATSSDQHYKLPSSESSKPHSTKPPENEQRFERRNENVSRHNSLVTTTSSQVYAYNLFSDYPPSNYAQIPSIPSTCSSYVPSSIKSSCNSDTSYVPVPAPITTTCSAVPSYVPIPQPVNSSVHNYVPLPPPVGSSVTSYVPPPITTTCSSVPNYVPVPTPGNSSVPNYKMVPPPVCSSVSSFVSPPITTTCSSVSNFVSPPGRSSVTNYVPVPPPGNSSAPNYKLVPPPVSSSITNYVSPPITTTCSSVPNYVPVPPPINSSVSSYVPPPLTTTCSSVPNYVPMPPPGSSSVSNYVAVPSSGSSSVPNYKLVPPPVSCSVTSYVPPPPTCSSVPNYVPPGSNSVPNYKLVPPPVSSSVSNYVPVPLPINSSVTSYVPPPLTTTCSSVPNYVPLSSSITSSSTESTPSSSFGSFSVAHNSSNFSILSWSTMSAPNTQHYSTECQKTNTSYQHSNESSSKLPSFQQSNNNNRISYPPQNNKEIIANNRISYPPQLNKETTPRPPVNWMTAPDVRHEHMPTQNTFDHTQVPSDILPKDNAINCGGGNFSNNAIYSEFSENLPHAWQGGNKSQPLPTLIGDLALGPTPPSRKYCSSYKQPVVCSNYKQPVSKLDNKDKRGDYGAPSTFLSVSQLVESNIKEPRTSRKANRPSNKPVNRKERNNKNNQFTEPIAATTYPAISNWPAPKSSYKTAPSNYSAESLIAVPTQQEMLSAVDKTNSIERYSQNYTSRSHFTTESTTANYFSESLEPNYQQYSSNPSNYQSNNYTNQTFPPTEIPSSALPSFSSELGSSNFPFPTTTATTRPNFFPTQIPNTTKSSRSNKRRHNVDDNYHYNNFVLGQDNTGRSSSQQARCNESQPTYHSTRNSAGVQTPGNSVAGAGASSSLTNFNLSTIFPEINDKAPLPPLPAFVSSKNLSTSAPLISGSSTDYMLHPANMGFNNLLNPPHQVGIGLNQSFPTPNFSMPPSLAFSVHEH